MKRQRWMLLPLVLLLLILGWFLSQDKGKKDNKDNKISEKRVFPREQRRSYHAHRPQQAKHPRTSQNDAGQKVHNEQGQSLPADAFERAYADPKSRALLSVQVNAIQNSPLAQKIIHCREQESSQTYAQVKEKLGIDISQDIDRMAIGENVVVMSGFFSDLKIPEEFGEGEKYDENSEIYSITADSSEDPQMEKDSMYLAKIDDQILLMGDSREDIEASIDRMNKPDENFTDPLEGQINASDMGGFIGPGFIKELATGSTDQSDPLVQQIADTVGMGSFSANVGDEVMMSADLTAGMGDSDKAKDLAQSIAGGIAAMRLQAAKDGDKDLLEMLELARVKQVEENGELSPNINLDLAIPAHQILKAMGCDDDGNPLQNPALGQGRTTVKVEKNQPQATPNSDTELE